MSQLGRKRSTLFCCRTLSVFALFLYVACAPIAAGQSQTLKTPHVLDALRFGTGWILIGALDVKTELWATILKHRVTQRLVASDSIVPLAGDILEITMELPVLIVDYESRGEENRLISPAGRVSSTSNMTGVMLSVGTSVIVEEIARDPLGNVKNVQRVFARVARAPRDPLRR
jgi:hypothetical protein